MDPASTQAVMKLTITVTMMAMVALEPGRSMSTPASFAHFVPNTFGVYQIEPTTMLDAVAIRYRPVVDLGNHWGLLLRRRPLAARVPPLCRPRHQYRAGSVKV